MSLKKFNTVLAAAFILFILWFGSEFILSPETTAPGFGLPSWPSGDGGGFLSSRESATSSWPWSWPSC